MQLDCLKLNCITLVWVYLCNDTDAQSSRTLSKLRRQQKLQKSSFIYPGVNFSIALVDAHNEEASLRVVHFDVRVESAVLGHFCIPLT